jgi:hypothetical protein
LLTRRRSACAATPRDHLPYITKSPNHEPHTRPYSSTRWQQQANASAAVAYSDTADPSPAPAGKEHIPACLRDALERDPTYKASLLFDRIEDSAYYDEEEEEADATLVLDRVEAVFQGSHLCKQHTMDENAWCLHAVTLLLQLAIVLYGRGRFRQESVHVSLFLSYLHTNNIDNRNPSSPHIFPPPLQPAPRLTHVFRKTDFCLSYSHLHPLYASLYKALRHAPISYTIDTYTEAAAFFTGIEGLSPSGNL